MKNPTYSYSQLDTYMRCHKKWWWEYKVGLTRKSKAYPLQVGIVTHIILDLYTQDKLLPGHLNSLPDALRELFPDNDPEELDICASECSRLFVGYMNKWGEDTDIKIVSPEMHLKWEGPEFNLYARMDALAEDSIGRWRLERKTTSRMDSAFLGGMQRGLQTAIAHFIINKIMPEMKVRGSLFDLIAKTKVPQYSRTMVPIPPWKIDYALQVVQGCHEDIMNERFYPSLDCEKYNKECEHAILCRHDTPENREIWYEQRKEGFEREAKVLRKYFSETPITEK
jgi:hypothetical protein